ncbi:MAG: flavohemoglobin expression-modulating QEGLA motif protein [Candidatus Neomarinimicrobiota bacterium]
MLSQKERLRLSHASELLYKISRRVRILGHLTWPNSVRHKFFRSGSEKLPKIDYPLFDSEGIKVQLQNVREKLGDLPMDKWLLKKTKDIEESVNLIDCCGSPDFFKYSAKIYGTPTSKLRDGKTTPIDLAKRFESIMQRQKTVVKNKLNKNSIDSLEMKNRLEERVNIFFGKESPEVLIVDGISAKATASSRRIRLRKNAVFTERDVDQLINHEAMVHVATTLNGRHQHKMRILGGNYGSITKTQEGLAVFAEFITGCIDIRRMYRIMDRVEAIQMSIEGADFIEVYRYFLDRSKLKTEAFENARRIFRGGVITGRYPFTKDMVYLDGLVRVYNFIRAVISRGRNDVLKLLFSGKMDLDDMPIILEMDKEGLINHPKFLPDWVIDKDYLTSYFSFSIFIGEMDHQKTDDYYEQLF